MRAQYLPAKALVVVLAASLSACASRPAPKNIDPIKVSSVQASPKLPLVKTTIPEPASGPLTVQSAVQRAVRWHPSVAEAVARLRQQRESIREAKAGYLPRLNWGIDSAYDAQDDNNYRPMLNVSGSQTIYDFGKVDGRIKLANAGVQGREAKILIAVDDIAHETATALIEVKRHRLLLKVAEDQIKDVKSTEALVRKRTETGASTQSDQLQATARVQAAEATAFQMQSDLRRWEAILAVMTGMQGTPSLDDKRPAFIDNACSAGEPVWERVPVIMEARATQNTATAQLRLSRAEGLPSLELEGRVGSDLSHIGSKPEMRIGFNVTGSLYNGGVSEARRNAANHSIAASEAVIATARVDVNRSLMEASGQIASLTGLKKTLDKTQGVMRQTRNLYRSQYLELGTRTLLDLLNADQEYHAARFQSVNIDHDLQKLGVDCIYNSGRVREVFGLEGHKMQDVTL